MKGYYPFLWYGKFYDLDAEIRSDADPDGIYTLCGVDKDGKVMATVTYYVDDDDAPPKGVKLNFGKSGKYEVYYLDNSHDPTVCEITDSLEFTLERFTSVLIKEI